MPAEPEPSSSDTPSFLLPAGPSVPRSHSFLPLRSGPPIYFPLPAPYDGYCLTEYFQSDLSPSEPVIKGQGEGGEEEDVSMTEEERGAALAENYEARQRIIDVVAPAGSRGWEYPSECFPSCIISRPEDADVRSYKTDRRDQGDEHRSDPQTSYPRDVYAPAQRCFLIPRPNQFRYAKSNMEAWPCLDSAFRETKGTSIREFPRNLLSVSSPSSRSSADSTGRHHIHPPLLAAPSPRSCSSRNGYHLYR